MHTKQLVLVELLAKYTFCKSRTCWLQESSIARSFAGITDNGVYI